MVFNRCAVVNCGNNSKDNKNLRWYCFPKDDLNDEWVRFCKQKKDFNTNAARICQYHFTENDFERNIAFEMGKLIVIAI